jgi:general secretion pathway protein G
MLVVIAIVCGLAAFIVPQVQKVGNKAKQTKSLGNLRTIGIAVATYLGENNNVYPLSSAPGITSPFWTEKISPYLPEARGGWKDVSGNPIKNSPALIDPLIANGQHGASILGDYGANTMAFGRSGPPDRAPIAAASLAKPSGLVTVLTASVQRNGKEAGAWWLDGDWYCYGNTTTFPSDRGMGSVLCLFADGHTEMIKKDEFIRNKVKLLLPN